MDRVETVMLMVFVLLLARMLRPDIRVERPESDRPWPGCGGLLLVFVMGVVTGAAVAASLV